MYLPIRTRAEIEAKSAKAKLTGLIMLAVCVVSFIMLIGYLLPPTVQFDMRTGQCVKVIGADDKYNCYNLPEKYQQQWIN